MTAGDRLFFQFAAISDVGRIRKDNQDSGYAGPWLLAVCDGVGGAARGDLASSTAVGQIRNLDHAPVIPADGELTSDTLLGQVADSLDRAHRRIAEMIRDDPSLQSTSTTATVGLFDGSRLALGHVGDSRAYLLRAGELTQLTHDHTFVQTLVDEGRITEDEARVHPHRNLILRAIDGQREVEPDLIVLDLEAGDRLMFCSDGVCGSLEDPRIHDILTTGSPDFAAVELVRASLDAGSSDNVTCVVADVTLERTADPIPQLVGAAAEMRRRKIFKGHRSGDTGELEPLPLTDGDDLPAGARADDPIDPEAMRYAPRPPGRHTWLRRILALLVVVGLLWAGIAVTVAWTQRQFYVGELDGHVAIFRGVPTSVLGFDLGKPYETTDVSLDSLSDFDANAVSDGVTQSSRTDAEKYVQTLADRAATDAGADPSASPSASPSSTPSSTPSGTA